MTPTFETGGVLRLNDEATSVLERIGIKFDAFDKKLQAVSARLGSFVPPEFRASMNGVVDQFMTLEGVADKVGLGIVGSMTEAAAKVGVRFEDLQKLVTGSFASYGDAAVVAADKINLVMGRIDAQIAASTKGMAELAASTSAMHMPGAGGLGGARNALGHRGSGGVHYGRVGSELPGGTHISMGSNGMLAALGIAGYGIYEAAEVEDIVKRAAMTGQLPLTGNVLGTPQGKALYDAIQRGAATTGFAPREVGEAILGSERQFGGLDFDKRLEVLQKLMPMAGLEAHMKETGLGESMEAMVGLMHMSGEFNPQNLPELSRAFAFSSMITPSTLGQFGSALSYSMPKLHAGMEMDPAVIMLMTAGMQNAGVRSTKSGTWLKDFFQKTEPDTDIVGDLTKSQVKHNDALRQLGLIDDSGASTWIQKDATGKPDWMTSVLGLSSSLGTKLKSYGVADRLELMKNAFGEQGSGFAGLLTMPQFTEQLPILAGKMKAFKGGEGALDEYASGSTVQQARDAWRETQNLLMDIGRAALPAVNSGLKDLQGIFGGIASSPAMKLFEKMTSEGVSPMAAAGTAAREATKDIFTKALPDAVESAIRNAPPGLPSIPDRWKQMQHGLYGGTVTKEAFGGFGGGEESPLSQAVYLGFMKAFKDLSGGGANDNAFGMGGTAGFTNAAYTTWGSGGISGAGRFANLSASGLTGEHADYIRRKAAALGIDPRYALAVAHSEGLGGRYAGDYGTSFGDFQLHYGGSGIRGMNSMGLGDAFTKATGLDARDPSTWKAQADFALQQVRKGGWSPWHGAAHVGIHGFDGVGSMPSVRPVPMPPRRHDIVVHNTTTLDGKVLARSTSRYQAAMGRFPTKVGGVDSHGNFVNPGTPLSDVA